ncbi:hypothetical protein TSUD_353400 [Trifolium subterraneum]|uniref:Uncharacterized protein n=1 Tax=Trifolium subterraneum TaxID=3900 RepID=A0A2Z6MWL6_TRISU|nr:hypothetical protein TSUD_353400 [Trifolium subterraneum]
MRCKKHLPDPTSTVGVCASCLRERLQPILEAQAQAQPSRISVSENDLSPSQPNFSRSESPFVAHRKSDDRRREVLFQTAPKIDRGFEFSGGTATAPVTAPSKRRIRRFWILSNFFRPRSTKSENSSAESYDPSSSVSPPSWLSTDVPVRRKNNNRVSDQKRCRQFDRGASPVDNNNFEENYGLDSGSESSPRQRNKATAGAVTARRSKLCYAGKSLTSMALCLSPLVRASPNRQWNSHKGMANELGVGGVHHISTAASYCANRSRKLVDLGRVANR